MRRTPRTRRSMRRALWGTAAALAGIPVVACPAGAASAPTIPTIHPVAFAHGAAAQSLTDDVTVLGNDVFVTYQNGVGPDGSASTSGVTQSSVVEYGPAGNTVRTWQITGRVDGLTADPAHNRIFATSNEDNNSSLYVIIPTRSKPLHYTYSPNPAEQAPGEASPNGGTDSVSIGTDGSVYVAHSNPDPGVPSAAAVFRVTLSGTTATLTPLFRVNDPARDVVTNKPVTLGLTDPDSNRFVPVGAPVLPRTLLQVSQGDGQLIIVNHPRAVNQSLSRLMLSNAENTTQPTIDDVIEVTGPGTLYVADQKAGTVQAIDTAGFAPGSLVVAQPADTGNAGQLGILDAKTGKITHFPNTFTSPKGLAFLPGPATPPPATPEASTVVALPLAAVAIGSGFVLLRRRRAVTA
ncbi:MAG: hypothetical protein M3137_10370 [Actinomycetota bacterium]|nr:hypothetical protein [Actinomycetota bacterium]